MDLAPIPILCAGCNARIELRYDQLDQPMACVKCGEPINVNDYDVLIDAKRWLLESRKKTEQAHKDRERQANEHLKELQRQELERSRAEKRIVKEQENEHRYRQKAIQEAESAKALEDRGGRVTSVTEFFAGLCVMFGGASLLIGVVLFFFAAVSKEAANEGVAALLGSLFANGLMLLVGAMFTYLAIAVVRYLAKIRKEMRDLRELMERNSSPK